MSDRRRLGQLVAVLVISAFAVGAVSIALLYRASYREQERSLVEQASLWAQMIEAVARFDAVHSAGDVSGGAVAATLSQVREAYEGYARSDHYRELTIARVDGDHIAFLFNGASGLSDEAERVPIDSPRADAMRWGLAGKSGTIAALDYRGVEVLAAYEPIPSLAMAVVVKIDLAQIRAPFLRAGVWTLLAVGAVIIIGTKTLIHLGVPLIEQSAASEMRYRELFAGAPIGLWEEDFSGVKEFVDELSEAGIGDIEAHFNACPEALDACAARVRILDVNQAAIDLHGARDKSELLDRLTDTFCAESFVTFKNEVLCLAKGGREFVAEATVCRLDGGQVPISLRLSLGADAIGDWSKVMISMEDITKRKKAEEQLLRSNAELQRFNRLAIGREMRMVELKRQINELCAERGSPALYDMESETRPIAHEQS